MGAPLEDDEVGPGEEPVDEPAFTLEQGQVMSVDRTSPAHALAAKETEKSHGRAPQPPKEEVAERFSRVRRGLVENDLDALVIFASAAVKPEPARYLSGYVHVFSHASSILIIAVDRDPIMLIDQPWHLREARRMSWIDDIRTFPNGNLVGKRDELRRVLKKAMNDAGATRSRIGIFRADMPEVYRAALEAAVPDSKIEDGKNVWEKMVARPTAYDLERIRASARVGDLAHDASVDACFAGATEYDVCLAAMKTIAEAGGEFLHGSGVSSHVNIGSNSEIISNVRPFLFTTRKLQSHEMFWLDMTASIDGYYNDTCQTIVIGEPSKEQRDIYSVCREMYDEMVAKLRPGVSGGDVWEVGMRIARRYGHEGAVNHVYFGHTTGIVTSAAPVIHNGENREIVAGSVVNIEPGIFVPGVGLASIESAFHVTADGASRLNDFDEDLQIAS